MMEVLINGGFMSGTQFNPHAPKVQTDQNIELTNLATPAKTEGSPKAKIGRAPAEIPTSSGVVKGIRSQNLDPQTMQAEQPDKLTQVKTTPLTSTPSSKARENIESLMKIRANTPSQYTFNRKISKHPIDVKFLAELKKSIREYEKEKTGSDFSHRMNRAFASLFPSVFKSLTQEADSYYHSIASNLPPERKAELILLENPNADPRELSKLHPDLTFNVEDVKYKDDNRDFVYSGKLKNGNPHGEGQLIESSGIGVKMELNILQGTFENGKLKSGEQIKGKQSAFNDDLKLNGQGTILDEKGDVKAKGIFKNGNLENGNLYNSEGIPTLIVNGEQRPSR